MTRSTRFIDADELGDALIPVIVDAGQVLLAHFHAGVEIEKKPDRSPVTVADRESEEIILGGLERVSPSIPVIAEEAMAAGHVPPQSDRFFLVDALDGTRHFVRGSPEFSINVGLIENGRPVFGLIYSPASARMFLTRSDGGAYEFRCNAANLPGRGAGVEMRRINTRVPDRDNLRAFNSLSSAGKSSVLLRALAVKEAQPLGSAIKFCLIAAGEGDVYARIGETYEWDTASGQAILEAAGGMVTDLDGVPLSYGQRARGYLNPPFVAWGQSPLIGDLRSVLCGSDA